MKHYLIKSFKSFFGTDLRLAGGDDRYIVSKSWSRWWPQKQGSDVFRTHLTWCALVGCVLTGPCPFFRMGVLSATRQQIWDKDKGGHTYPVYSFEMVNGFLVSGDSMGCLKVRCWLICDMVREDDLGQGLGVIWHVAS